VCVALLLGDLVKKLFFLFLLAAFMLPACSEAPTATPTKAPLRATNTPLPARPTPNAAELEISDPTKPIEVTAGSDFTITVRTNRSPELHWELSEMLEADIVGYVWKDHIPDDPADVNSSGRDVWRFKAVGPGTTTIALGYYNGMESTTTQTFIYTVVVK
jgi:predicted secreted protein